MADNTAIEWTHRPGTKGETWNPLAGCSIYTPGCINCYAMRMAARIEAIEAAAGRESHYAGTTKKVKGKAVWTGKIAPAPDRILTAPLRWKSPRTVFVNSMSDLFHEAVPDEVIDRVFAVMAAARQHTFQVLTKRSKRMREYLNRFRPSPEWDGFITRDGVPSNDVPRGEPVFSPDLWPRPNIWLGVSAEDQTRADERVPDLLGTPAAVRFVSAEPLLGPIDFRQWLGEWGCNCGWGGSDTIDHCPECGWVGHGPTIETEGGDAPGDCPECSKPLSDYYACPECEGTGQDGSGFGPNSTWLDQIIVGGESGSGARPMHPDWPRAIRDQCAAAGTAFFFKQWGDWLPHKPQAGGDLGADVRDGRVRIVHPSARSDVEISLATAGRSTEIGSRYMERVGKHRAGRLLDGVEHNGFPEARR